MSCAPLTVVRVCSMCVCVCVLCVCWLSQQLCRHLLKRARKCQREFYWLFMLLTDRHNAQFCGWLPSLLGWSGRGGNKWRRQLASDLRTTCVPSTSPPSSSLAWYMTGNCRVSGWSVDRASLAIWLVNIVANKPIPKSQPQSQLKPKLAKCQGDKTYRSSARSAINRSLHIAHIDDNQQQQTTNNQRETTNNLNSSSSSNNYCSSSSSNCRSSATNASNNTINIKHQRRQEENEDQRSAKANMRRSRGELEKERRVSSAVPCSLIPPRCYQRIEHWVTVALT